MPPLRRPSEQSPFAALERAFAVLSAEPRPLALDGASVAGLPARAVPLDELKARLLHPSTPYATRDAALGILIARAKAEGGAWTVGLAGVLLPGMRRALEPLVEACPAKQADLEAQMLVGFLAALARCAPGRARPAGFLCGRAYDAAKQLVRSELAERARPAHRPISAEPPKPWGHPDFVLARAVTQGVICADDAELIGATRLGEMTLAGAARAWGLDYKAAAQRRRRSEVALVAWILQETGPGFVADRRVPAGSKGAGRPRQGRRPQQRPEGHATASAPPESERR